MIENYPKVTFGIIVLNGEPFTTYCLKALYPYAHQIIVVEGACEGARAVATADGHSRDGTLEKLHQFKENHDPENKLIIVTKDGFWSEKEEQSQQYADRATGDYLWQIDIDEFYKPEDFEAVFRMLKEEPQITVVCFHQLQFWGSFSHIVDSWFLRRGVDEIHRLFKWGEGYRYVDHRPPTVVDEKGVNLRSKKWIRSKEMRKRGIFLYHYSLVFPLQAENKSHYYEKASWNRRNQSVQWFQEVYLKLKRPFRVHNAYEKPGWLEHFKGTHPPIIDELIADIESGKVKMELRETADIEALLKSKKYLLGRFFLQVTSPIYKLYYHISWPMILRYRKLKAIFG